MVHREGSPLTFFLYACHYLTVFSCFFPHQQHNGTTSWRRIWSVFAKNFTSDSFQIHYVANTHVHEHWLSCCGSHVFRCDLLFARALLQWISSPQTSNPSAWCRVVLRYKPSDNWTENFNVTGASHKLELGIHKKIHQQTTEHTQTITHDATRRWQNMTMPKCDWYRMSVHCHQ